MAIINFNIDADGVEDFHATLRKLLAGDGAKTLVIDHVSRAIEQKPVAPVIIPVDDTVADLVVVQTDNTPVTNDAVLDAHGHPWSAALHASTKALTKEGIWRMKPGAVRPNPMPGYPMEAIEVVAEPEPVTEVVETSDAVEVVETSDADEAEMWMDAAGDAPVATVPAREWTDADLSKLCNQAAKALEPKGAVPALKELVAIYSASGTVPHSRNVPVEDRERFAGEVEALANITYEG